MSESLINVSSEDGVNLIRFNRADKKNALTAAMYSTITDALNAGDSDDNIRVHVLLGQPGVFTAGNDLKDFLQHSNSGDDDSNGLGAEVLGFLRKLVTTDKPVVAGVDGLAIGVGTTMLMHCDLVYASARSFFQTPFTNLGLVPEAASSLVGPRLFGRQQAFALLALGERWSAEDALRAGLINRLIAEEELEATVLSVAKQLAAKPAAAVAITRQLLLGNKDELLARIDEEAEHFASQLASPEAKQAFAAFLNR